jgi:DNA-binding transcriptional LysR family regulator
MLDVRRMMALLEVSRQGSFSRAAQALGYTQPAVSRQIALLERESGATLVDRRPDGVRLTDAGRILVRHAEAIVARLGEARAEIQAVSGLERGSLRLSTFTSAAATMVPLAITAFRERLPGIDLSVLVVDTAVVLETIRGGDVDIALSLDPEHLELEELDAIHLFEEPMHVALPPGHPLSEQDRVDLASLADERWMFGTTVGCPDARRFTRACHAAGFEPTIAFHNDDYNAILGFVAAGVGVAPIPDMVARSARDDVCIRSLAPEAPTRPIIALLPGGYRPPAAEAMVDVLRQVSEVWTEAGAMPVAQPG